MLLRRRGWRRGRRRWGGTRRGRIACRVRWADRAGRIALRGTRPAWRAGERPVGRRLMHIWADRTARDGFHGDDGARGAGDGRGRMGVGNRGRGVGRRCEGARGCMPPGSRITGHPGPLRGGGAGDANRRECQDACDCQDGPPRGRRRASTCGVRHRVRHTGPPSRRQAVAQCVCLPPDRESSRMKRHSMTAAVCNAGGTASLWSGPLASGCARRMSHPPRWRRRRRALVPSATGLIT